MLTEPTRAPECRVTKPLSHVRKAQAPHVTLLRLFFVPHAQYPWHTYYIYYDLLRRVPHANGKTQGTKLLV